MPVSRRAEWIALPPPQRGISWLEPLVALALVAVAIIGVAALYVEASSARGKTEPHAQASALADRIAARIVANQAGRQGYASVVGVVCNPNLKPRRVDDAASQEAACWHDEVEKELPSGMGSITRDTSTAPATYVIAVSWAAQNTGAASFVMRVQPSDTPTE